MGNVEYPENDFTRMIEAVAQGNRSGVRGGVPVSAEPRPSVQSAAVGKEVAPAEGPAPLTTEERAELDRLAIEAGVKDERLANVGTSVSQGNYATLEEALAAGAPVRPVTIEDQSVPDGATAVVRKVPVDPKIGLSPIGRPVKETVIQKVPTLPNFKNVQGIDLVRGVVYVDDMEFPMEKAALAELRRYAVDTAREEVLRRLDAATEMFEDTQAEELPEGDDGGEPPAKDV